MKSVARQPIRPGNVGVFGSVATAVTHTTLDDKWLPVAQAGLDRRGEPWSAILARTRHLSRRGQIFAVNSWVNAHISYVEDIRQYGTLDYWASATQSLTLGRGDCEDYAIAKMQILRTLGVPARSMSLVIARDLVRQIDHAMLAVSLNGELLVLDNETNQIRRSEEIRNYRALLSFNATTRWAHGYEIEPSAAQSLFASLERVDH